MRGCVANRRVTALAAANLLVPFNLIRTVNRFTRQNQVWEGRSKEGKHVTCSGATMDEEGPTLVLEGGQSAPRSVNASLLRYVGCLRKTARVPPESPGLELSFLKYWTLGGESTPLVHLHTSIRQQPYIPCRAVQPRLDGLLGSRGRGELGAILSKSRERDRDFAPDNFANCRASPGFFPEIKVGDVQP
jgi:hypothetical protein